MLATAELGPEEYRALVRPRGLVSARLRVKETDVLISAGRDLSREALPAIRSCREQIESYIGKHPVFSWSLEPVPMDEEAPDIIRDMLDASARANVGPMATVAGAVADHIGRRLLPVSRDLIVENGGDIMLHVSSRREMLLLAESSPFKGLKVAVGPTEKPAGICTSSGKLGHSLSFGMADAVTVFAESAALADAAATSVGNMIKSRLDIERGIDRAREIGVDGIIILAADRIGAWGQVEIIG
ncbi:MAG: UPF0280 family protein [Desulfobacteraceae bacterium]|nr:UPF0280 family protein [Desulfobacteraceae bacterium]